MKNEIVLKQLLIIVHKLQDAGKSVQKRIDDLELDKQIATEENVKSMKALRAELNNEFKDLEQQRGVIKKAVNEPYLAFEDVFKTEITDRYKKATDLLKNNIDSVEYKIKKEKENNVKEYFDELVLSEKIDFLKFEDLKIEVNLSTSEKKYKEQTNEFVMKIVDDLSLIKSTDFEAEILTEYKLTLNASKAITTIKTRKEVEAIEAAKLKAEQTQNRKNYLSKLGLNYVEITNSYEYNDEIFVSLSDIINRSKEEFTKIYADIEAKIKDLKAKEIVVVETIQNNIENHEKGVDEISVTIRNKSVYLPISAPTIESPIEEIKTASFEVKAPLMKLRALGIYMKSQGIEYKNI
jgi:hypothetical protein